MQVNAHDATYFGALMARAAARAGADETTRSLVRAVWGYAAMPFLAWPRRTAPDPVLAILLPDPYDEPYDRIVSFELDRGTANPDTGHLGLGWRLVGAAAPNGLAHAIALAGHRHPHHVEAATAALDASPWVRTRTHYVLRRGQSLRDAAEHHNDGPLRPAADGATGAGTGWLPGGDLVDLADEAGRRLVRRLARRGHLDPKKKGTPGHWARDRALAPSLRAPVAAFLKELFDESVRRVHHVLRTAGHHALYRTGTAPLLALADGTPTQVRHRTALLRRIPALGPLVVSDPQAHERSGRPSAERHLIEDLARTAGEYAPGARGRARFAHAVRAMKPRTTGGRFGPAPHEAARLASHLPVERQPRGRAGYRALNQLAHAVDRALLITTPPHDALGLHRIGGPPDRRQADAQTARIWTLLETRDEAAVAAYSEDLAAVGEEIRTLLSTIVARGKNPFGPGTDAFERARNELVHQWWSGRLRITPGVAPSPRTARRIAARYAQTNRRIQAFTAVREAHRIASEGDDWWLSPDPHAEGIVPLTTPTTLIEEGTSMDNCAAGLVGSCLGEPPCHVYHLAADDGEATLIVGEEDPGKLRLLQLVGPHNGIPSPGCQALASAVVLLGAPSGAARDTARAVRDRIRAEQAKRRTATDEDVRRATWNILFQSRAKSAPAPNPHAYRRRFEESKPKHDTRMEPPRR